jgi:hypothetical protein
MNYNVIQINTVNLLLRATLKNIVVTVGLEINQILLEKTLYN